MKTCLKTSIYHKHILLISSAFLVLFYVFCTPASASAQNKRFPSIQMDANYFYYRMGGNTRNSFNYGFSFLLSETLNNIKISSGINYATKNYYYQVDPDALTYFLTKREYKQSLFQYSQAEIIKKGYCIRFGPKTG